MRLRGRVNLVYVTKLKVDQLAYNFDFMDVAPNTPTDVIKLTADILHIWEMFTWGFLFEKQKTTADVNDCSIEVFVKTSWYEKTD